MSNLGKRIVVFTMMWVLLVMALTQLYDNVTGKNLPPPKATPVAVQPTIEPDPAVTRLADLQSCVASNPKNLQCTMDLADFYYQAHQWSQAQVTYEIASILDPHNPALLLKLAGTYIYQEMFSQAISTLRGAEVIKPDSPEIHLLLGLSLSKVEPPQLAEAVTEWRTVVSLDPSSAWAAQAQQYISEASK